jgi:hypothetical protein
MHKIVAAILKPKMIHLQVLVIGVSFFMYAERTYKLFFSSDVWWLTQMICRAISLDMGTLVTFKVLWVVWGHMHRYLQTRTDHLLSGSKRMTLYTFPLWLFHKHQHVVAEGVDQRKVQSGLFVMLISLF